MTLFLILAFKESEGSGGTLGVDAALRVCLCMRLVALSLGDSLLFACIYFLLLSICLLPVMMVGIKHV